MPLSNEKIEELVSLYSLGILEESEIEELERLLGEDSGEIENLIRENELVTSLIGYHISPVSPPAGLKKRLMQRIKLKNKLEERSYTPSSLLEKIKPFWYGLGGAVAACALMFSFYNYSIKTKYETQIKELAGLKEISSEQKNTILALKQDLIEKEEKIAELSKIDSMKAELVDYIENPSVIVVDLDNLKPELNSLGRILFDMSKSSAIFCGLNLPQTSPDKVYQLWAIIDSKPHSHGIFGVDKNGNGVIRLEKVPNSDKIQTFAVTLEPAGGVPQPTGEMYLAGNFL